MKNLKKKLICTVLAVTMLLGAIPMAYAATPFKDVSSGAWYTGFVDYVYQNRYMEGTSATTFEPNSPMTRAMFATVLHKITGKPASTNNSPFTDIAGTWYTNAVNWCYAQGIVAGTTSTTFAPNHHVTREQMAVIMKRYAEYKGLDVSSRTDLSRYADAGRIHDYAVDALEWAVSVGLMKGVSANTIAPRHNATRAQCAVVLQRFVEWMDSAEPETTEPAPTEPEVTEPAPTEPEVTEPAPTGPEVTEPAPTEPPVKPTEPPVTEPPATEPAPPAPTECHHNWTTVNHPEEGHKQGLCVCKCGQKFTSADAWSAHIKAILAGENPEDAVLYHSGWYDDSEWIVDKPAWSETVCSDCGAKQ